VCFVLVFHLDILNLKKLQDICDDLLKKSTSSVLIEMCRCLNDDCYDKKRENPSELKMQNPMDLTEFSKKHKSLEEILFHTIYSWYCFHPYSSTLDLANLLKKEGYYNEAFAICPRCKLLNGCSGYLVSWFVLFE